MARLGRVLPLVALPLELSPPQVLEEFDHSADCLLIARRRTEVPRARGPALGVDSELLGQSQVAAERAEDVLPGAHGARVTDLQRSAGFDRAHGVRPEPVLAPVAAAEDVSRTRGRHRGGAACVEERTRVRGGDELRARLGARVWV